MAAAFEWPWQYNFPPFFTVQPTADTREKQVEAWGELITAYCKHNTIEVLNLAEASSTELFNNKKISRSLNQQAVVDTVSALAEKRPDNFMFLDGNKDRCLVMWRSPQEWGSIIYNWVDSTGQNGSIMTLYELRCGDLAAGQEFEGIGVESLRRALEALEGQSKAKMFEGDDDDAQGVKFF